MGIFWNHETRVAACDFEVQAFFPEKSRFYGWEFAGFLLHSSHIFPTDARGEVKRKKVHGSIQRRAPGWW